MAIILVKRGSSDPLATQVTNAGEMAVNTSTPKLFLKTISDSSTLPVWIGATIESSPSDWTNASKLATQSAINTTFMPKSGGAFTSNITLNAQSDLRFADSDSSNWVAFQAPATVASNVTWTLPASDGTAGHVLSTDGSGTLSWASAGSASSVTVTSDNTNTTRYLVLSSPSSTASLYVDDSTTPLAYNPFNNTMSLGTYLALSGAGNGSISAHSFSGSRDDIAVVYQGLGSDTNSTITLTGASTAASTAAIDATTTTITSTTINIDGAIATTGSSFELPTSYTFADTGTATNTLNIQTGVTASGATKTLNIGTGGAAGSTTDINIGSTNGGTVTINSDVNVGSGKVYKINGTGVLSASTLGSGVTSSSLTSVGTLTSGALGTGFTTVAVAQGGTGTSTGSITGTGALTFTAGGSNTNINLAPNGTGTVDVASKRITNVQTPSANNDAATKQYVDDVAQGLHIHSTADAATTAKLSTLAGVAVSYSSGTQAITWTGGTALTSTFTDGQALTASTTEASASRLLVKNEGDSSGLGSQYNGIYYCYGARELRRASDGNAAADWAGGDFVFVLAGTLYNNTGWVQTEKVNTLDTDPILWEQFSGAGLYTADEVTLTKSGSQFAIKSTYTGQSSITTVGTLTAGTLGSGFTTVATSVGGTGLTSFTSGGALYATSTSALTTGTLPVTAGGTGVTSLGTGVVTFLQTPSSSNLAAAVTGETGSGALVFGTSPAFTTSVTTGSASFDVFNGTATTVNAFGAATDLTLGATSGTAKIRNATTRLGNTTARVTTNSGTANYLSISPYGYLYLQADSSAAGLGGTSASITITNEKDASGQVRVEGGDIYIGRKSTNGVAYSQVDIIFEGATEDGFETTLTVADPSQDRTITLPNADGTVITTGNLTSITATGTITSGTWNGTDIALADGGTNASLTAANGGIIYSTASAMAISSVGSSGQLLTSGGAGAPTWTAQSSITAGNATVAATVTLTATNTTDATHYLVFSDAATGNEDMRTDTSLYYNPSTNVLTAGTVDAIIDGGTY